jgi:RNA-binding protein Nova
MSKANDFYPGSNERVCLITGSLEALANIVHFIGQKIREKPEHQSGSSSRDYDSKTAAERERQMKAC